MMKELLFVFFGGGLGSVARYGVAQLLKPVSVLWHGFPIHTLTANMAGCLLIGVLMGVFSKHPDQALSLLVVTGFCGGFTTFSTFSSECVALFRSGDSGLGLLYAAVSLAVCLLFAAAGYAVVK